MELNLVLFAVYLLAQMVGIITVAYRGWCKRGVNIKFITQEL